MKSHYRVVVIGGGVVGASVIYHLSKFGWKDIAKFELLESLIYVKNGELVLDGKLKINVIKQRIIVQK